MNAHASTTTTTGTGQVQPTDGNQAENLGEGHISGNLTADPELRFTPTGRAVANLRLAYAPRVQDEATGRWVDGEPLFYGVTVWGRQAENVVESLQRGDRIVAVGQWARRTWTDRDGKERRTVYLTARDIGPSLLFREVTIRRTQRSTLPISGPPPQHEDNGGQADESEVPF